MDWVEKINRAILFAGDVAILYLSLAITLYIRYGGDFYNELVRQHLAPFTIIFVVWVIIFYIAGLYDLNIARNTFDFSRTLVYTSVISAIVSISIFYLIPGFGISPKTNLFLFIAVFLVLEYNWRRIFNKKAAYISPSRRLLLIGSDETAKAIYNHIEEFPQLGYEISYFMKDGLEDPEFKHLAQIILARKINLIAIPAHVKKDKTAAREIYQNLALGIEVMDLADLYETIFKKVPLAELEEVWFLENLIRRHRLYETIKRPVEGVLATMLLMALSPLLLLIFILIKMTSAGPTIYKQLRVGQRGENFVLYKFRTMRTDAEKDGPRWSTKDDSRATGIGRVLRRTHLDELPQLLNIIEGDISFVGPRPERPEFVKDLEATIPYYDIRHLIKPGLTGWAQINYRYGSSVNDAYQKLQYDIYYVKNRSAFLDLAIIIRTIKLFFANVE